MIKIWYTYSMSGAVAKIIEQVESLTPDEKDEVGLYLLRGDIEDQEAHEKAWVIEIQRRVAEIDSGEAELVSLENVKKRFNRA